MQILSRAIGGVKSQVNLIGAPSFAQINPYGLYNTYKSDEYASQFPNIRPIVNELMTIPAHAVDGNGKPIPHPALNAIYHPNKTDSYVLFMEKLGVSVLSLDYTYLLVWRKTGGKAVPYGEFASGGMNIGGYTFLENPGIEYRDGKIYYKMGSQEFTEDEVIAIPGGAKPGNLYGGYSPSRASAKWATVDGYIGDFQKGFFENNAIPAGVFDIVAATPQEYKDIVAKLQDRHRGAGKNNNVSYSHTPVDSTGKAQQSQITWTPIAQSNKDIDFKNLLDHVDNRLSESYGVSSIIKGVDSAAKYSNAEVSEANFAKRAVNPLALRIFSQITHELNRITGGLGASITYKYEIPVVSDADKVKAETKQIEGDIINKYTSDPYNWSLNSVVDSFDLSKRYKLLEKGNDKTTIDNDKPEVDDGNEVKEAPDRTEIDGVTPLAKKKVKAEVTDEEKIKNATRDFMQSQINRAILELPDETTTALEEPTEDELGAYVVAMMAIIVGVLITYGENEYAAGAALAALDLSELQGFTLTETAEDTYRAYLQRVGTSYGNDTAESIRKAMLEARDQGLNRREMEAALRDIMNTDEWRVERLARTELNNSQNIGKLEGMKELSAQVAVSFEKTIDHSGVEPCPLCASQEGIWVPLEQPLWALGDSITVTDDKGEEVIYVNDWQTDEANDYHPNGKGTLIFRRTQ